MEDLLFSASFEHLQYFCPMSQSIFQQPVLFFDANVATFEKAMIETWYLRKGSNPITNQQSNQAKLIPHVSLERAITVFNNLLQGSRSSAAEKHEERDWTVLTNIQQRYRDDLVRFGLLPELVEALIRSMSDELLLENVPVELAEEIINDSFFRQTR